MRPASKVDWDALGPHFRAGIRSLKDIGAEFCVSDAAIIKHARKVGWTRDLKGKVQAKADAMVSAAAVSAEVSEKIALTERIVVQAEAQVQARIRIAHRNDIGRGRALTMALFAELEAQTGAIESFRSLGEILRTEGDNGADKLNDLYRAVISLPERTKTVKALSESLKNLIGLEREAYGIEAIAQKVEMTVARAVKEYTDDELAAIAFGGGARATDPAQGES